MWYLWLSTFVCYCALSWYSLVQSAAPRAPCRPGSKCYHPLIVSGQDLTLELWLEQPPLDDSISSTNEWKTVTSCRFNVTLPESGHLPTLLTSNGTTCEVPIPDVARLRRQHEVKPLQAQFVFLTTEPETVVASVPFELTKPKLSHPGGSWTESFSGKATPTRNLLDQSPSADNAKDSALTSPTWIPYLKYGRASVLIRFVADEREYGVLQRADGMRLHAWNQSFYAPAMYVDDLSLTQAAQLQLAPPESERPPVSLQVKISSLSPVMDSLNRQVHTSFELLDSMMPGDELDEIRYFLQDERLYRFALTQVISYIHMWLDYMAFRDEISFYHGKQNLSGVSTSSVVSRLVCSIIIFLYLLEGGGTSWVVLLSMFSSCVIELWKVWKLLRPSLSLKFPFVAVRKLQNTKEQQTAEYDRIAFRNLAMVLYPLVIGWSLYALRHYEYRSWYSWLISNLANAVYTFGFISLCPQLYVNYRLKSVAHLPWKVFVYKLFNTFVDDAFAWLIEMPWKHRIMTLRDDVVFLFFLVQIYLYRVDKSRTNEFGYSYEENDEAGRAGDSPKAESSKEKLE